MKYPKLWNGASPVGEALVRALQRNNAPYLSSVTADGVTANKMGGRSEVFQGGGGGGFISRPTWGDYNAPQYYATGSGPYAQFKPSFKQNMKRPLPLYQARFGKAENMGMVDWQGNGPDKVLSWIAYSWIGLASHRYAKGFHDVTKGVVWFLQNTNFVNSTYTGATRNFFTPAIRYQCVGSGLVVFRNMRVWRELREDQRISEFEYIQGAAISSFEGRSGCFVILRELNIYGLDTFSQDRTIRAGWLERDGSFVETHRGFETATGEFEVAVQGWYFNSDGSRAITTDRNGIMYEFTHERGFRVLEGYYLDPISGAGMDLGRDFFKDFIVRLNVRGVTPVPGNTTGLEYVGETVVKNEIGEYALKEWRIPYRKWDFDSEGTTMTYPHFSARLLGADLRAGAILVIENTYSPFLGTYYAPFFDDVRLNGSYKPVTLTADVVLYIHGEEVLRQRIEV